VGQHALFPFKDDYKKGAINMANTRLLLHRRLMFTQGYRHDIEQGKGKARITCSSEKKEKISVRLLNNGWLE